MMMKKKKASNSNDEAGRQLAAAAPLLPLILKRILQRPLAPARIQPEGLKLVRVSQYKFMHKSCALGCDSI